MRKNKGHRSRALIVGITGGTGAGKSIVSQIFNNLGAYIIDADAVGREILENDPKVIGQVIETFGKSILNPNEKISRKVLGNIVFNDSAKLTLLNSIIHPPMILAIKREVVHVLRSRRYSIVAVDAALIFETGVESYFDFIIAVVAENDKRIDRLQQRGLSRKNALTRIHSQIPQEEKSLKTHIMLENNGTIQELEEKATGLYKKILEPLSRSE